MPIVAVALNLVVGKQLFDMPLGQNVGAKPAKEVEEEFSMSAVDMS